MHLPAGVIRREGEVDDTTTPAAPRVPYRAADPLFRQVGMSLDDDA
jgi:hypothetical protein